MIDEVRMTLETFVGQHKCCAVNGREKQILDIFDRIPFHRDAIYPRSAYESQIRDLRGVRFLDGEIKGCNFNVPYTERSCLGGETSPEAILSYEDLTDEDEAVYVLDLL